MPSVDYYQQAVVENLEVSRSIEGREEVKWELGFSFFWRLGNRILCTGTGIHETKTIENGNGNLNLSNTDWAGIVGFELGLEKNKLLGNGIRTPPS